jgi:hypothetical protein
MKNKLFLVLLFLLVQINKISSFNLNGNYSLGANALTPLLTKHTPPTTSYTTGLQSQLQPLQNTSSNSSGGWLDKAYNAYNTAYNISQMVGTAVAGAGLLNEGYKFIKGYMGYDNTAYDQLRSQLPPELQNMPPEQLQAALALFQQQQPFAQQPHMQQAQERNVSEDEYTNGSFEEYEDYETPYTQKLSKTPSKKEESFRPKSKYPTMQDYYADESKFSPMQTPTKKIQQAKKESPFITKTSHRLPQPKTQYERTETNSFDNYDDSVNDEDTYIPDEDETPIQLPRRQKERTTTPLEKRKPSVDQRYTPHSEPIDNDDMNEEDDTQFEIHTSRQPQQLPQKLSSKTPTHKRHNEEQIKTISTKVKDRIPSLRTTKKSFSRPDNNCARRSIRQPNVRQRYSADDFEDED